jgi:hypothetical protein
VVSNRTTCPIAEVESATTQSINEAKTLKTIPLPVAQSLKKLFRSRRNLQPNR